MKAKHALLAAAVASALLAATACASGQPTATEAAGVDQAATNDPGGIRLVDADQAAAIQAKPPKGLVVLDVRTPEEFAQGHLENAIMVDFYDEDFAEQLAELDPDVPYLLYCRSGNRSAQTTSIMGDLGFQDVADVAGGIVAWAGAGNPVGNE